MWVSPVPDCPSAMHSWRLSVHSQRASSRSQRFIERRLSVEVERVEVFGLWNGVGRLRLIDQVKAYKPSHRVTAESVRAMLGIMPLDFATKGIVTTTSEFAPGVWTDPLIAPNIPSRLELVSGTELLAKLQAAATRDPSSYATLIPERKH